MSNVSFKERVKNIAISESKNYKSIFVDYEYLICSKIFSLKDYYIISAKENNYQHLLGINTSLSAKDFFNKCYNGTLLETDFDFFKRGQSESAVKGTVRRKIKVLGNMMRLFEDNFSVQEGFVKNNITCSFATSDNECTIGFIDVGKSIPRSLISGNELDKSNIGSVDLLFRKKPSDIEFSEMLIGDIETVAIYYERIKMLIDESAFLPPIKEVAVAKEEDV